MNILFLSLITFQTIDDSGIYPDLLREFVKNDHSVYILSPVENLSKNEEIIIDECNSRIVKVKTGKIQKTNIIEKGINTVLIEHTLKKAVKKYFRDIKFDLVLYPTPPITFANVIKYVKERDGAKSYLMLKDIFPQGAVDLGALSKRGIRGLFYNYFRKKEKKFYAVSDKIGCMSPANVEYVLQHNPEILPEKIEICPNSIEVRNLSLTAEEKINMREKYGLPVDKTIFVYGGNLGKPQGIPFIIECLKKQIDNSNAFFLIVGDGTEYGKLEKFFNQVRPANMLLIKHLPKEEYDKMIVACDVGMIFLDHRFTIPNFPSRILSYMQAKLPILACTDLNTDIGKVVVDNGFGWWCESDNVIDFISLTNNVTKENLIKMGNMGYNFLLNNYTSEIGYKIIVKNIK